MQPQMEHEGVAEIETWLTVIQDIEHDYLNQLQVLQGWLQMGRPQRAADYLQDVHMRLRHRHRLIELVGPRLGAFFLHLRRSLQAAGVRLAFRCEIEGTLDCDRGERLVLAALSAVGDAVDGAGRAQSAAAAEAAGASEAPATAAQKGAAVGQPLGSARLTCRRGGDRPAIILRLPAAALTVDAAALAGRIVTRIHCRTDERFERSGQAVAVQGGRRYVSAAEDELQVVRRRPEAEEPLIEVTTAIGRGGG